MTTEHSRRAARAITGLSSCLLLAGLIGGLPAGLYAAGGSPLPRTVPSWHQIIVAACHPGDGTLFLAVIRGISWLAWAAFTVCIMTETVSQVRGHPARPVLGLASVQSLAAALISAILAASTVPASSLATTVHRPAVAAPPRAGPADSPDAALPGQPDIAALPQASTVVRTHQTVPARPGTPAGSASLAAGRLAERPPQRTRCAPAEGGGTARPLIYRVRPGDDLWDIAARYLGNAGRWHELYRLNAGRPQPGGGTLANPSLIYPGWVLRLPQAAAPGTSASVPGPAQVHGHHNAARPASSPQRPRVSHHPGTTRPAQRQITQPHRNPARLAGRTAVSLPGGSLIGISVAVMVTAALTLTAIQRRRRYQPDLNHGPGVRPSAPRLPAVIAALRNAANAARPDPPATLGAVIARTEAEPEPDPYFDPYDDTDPGDTFAPAPATPLSAPASGRLPPPPEQRESDGPASTDQPGDGLRIGVRGTSEAVVDIAALGGIGLTGPGAPAAARAILTSLLARPGSTRWPRVIVPATDAGLILPGDGLVPGVSTPASAREALDEMETVIFRQSRAAPDPLHDAATEPGVVLIAASDSAITSRLAGVLAAGRPRQAGAVLIGPWEAGLTCYADADGTVTGTTPATPSLTGIRLFTLTSTEARAILGVMREAAALPSIPDAASLPGNGDPTCPGAMLAAPVGGSPLITARTTIPVWQAPAHAVAPSGDQTKDSPTRPIRITVLGPLTITAGGREISGGLRKARELLAYLAALPDGASAEAVSEALWPGSSPEAATAQRNLALRKARSLLRAATGMTALAWITRRAGRYRLDPAIISTDLSDFTAALDRARQATDPRARLGALRNAAALYRGELADGEGYDWAEPYAESARRRALDAWTAIAGILEPEAPAHALDALETALGHDPYNEYLYQQIMRLQAQAGHPEAVRRTLSLLESRLNDLGVTPGAKTRQIAAGLLDIAPGHCRPSVRSADQ
jgi:DNA-binding SARP family transcriptional activator